MKLLNTNHQPASLLGKGLSRIKKAWANYLCIVNGTYSGYRMYEHANEVALCGCSKNSSATTEKNKQARIFDDSFFTY